MNSFSLAIQGIFGRNFFGAGVLNSFKTKGIKPKIISAAAGALYSVYLYLDDNKNSLNYLKKLDDGVSDEFSFFSMLFFGSGTMKRINGFDYMKHYLNMSLYDQLNPWKAVPSIMYNPPENELELAEAVFNVLNKADLGVISNAYEYSTGKTVIYLNPAANQMLQGTPYCLGDTGGQELPMFVSRLFSVRGVCACLHAIEFGEPFDDQYEGAYQHNPLIAPLKICNHLVIVPVVPLTKPISKISSFTDAISFKMKMMFSNSIHSELNNIYLINRLLQEKKINEDKFHYITIDIIEPSRDAAFLDYFHCYNKDLFIDGMRQAEKMDLNDTPN